MASGSANGAIPARLLAASFLQPEYLVPLLERWRLIERLEEVRRCRLIEIQAPTGCGKTTLLYQWRNHLGKRGVLAAWLDVLRPDLDAADLLASLGWAMQIAGLRGVPRDLLEGAPDQIDVNRCLAELLAQISAVQGRVVIMIDDFHLLRAPASLALVDGLLAGAPPNLQIGIATRSAPGLSVAWLQARGLTHTVATKDLLFSSAEANEVLQNDMSPGDAVRLAQHTSGWPIAVQLARLWFRQLPVRERESLEFPKESGSIASFLTNQVIDSLADEQRSFLIDTSILTRITPALADAVRGRSDSADILLRLRTFAPLLMPIEGSEHIYKLHPLLAEQLKQGLQEREPQRFRAMQRAAALSLAGDHQLLDAIRHAKLAGDPDLPTALIAAREPVAECLLRGPGEIRPCLALLENRDWERHPQVWLARIFLLWRDSRFAEAERELSELRAQFPGGGPEYVRELVIVEVVLSRCEPGTIEMVLKDCNRQLLEAGAHSDSMNALLNTLRAISELQAGRLDKAQVSILEALAFYERSVAPIFILHGQLHVSWIAATRGNLSQAYELLKQIGRVAKRFGSAERGVRTLARAYMLGIEYEKGQLSASVADAAAFFDDLKKAWCWFDFFITASKAAIETAFTSDGAAAALVMIARVRGALAGLMLGDTADRLITLFEASVLARSGEPMGALGRLASVETGLPIRTWYEFDARMFANGIAHVVSDDPGATLSIAQEWRERAESEGRRPALCRAEILTAVALWRQGRREPAAERMQSALSIAAVDHLMAPFREHGVYLGLDLERLLEAGGALGNAGERDFVEELRGVLKGSADSVDVLDRLSDRESEVFDALCRHESNKAIGRRLGVSEHAVKFHVKNIFRKLGVHSREEAIAASSASQQPS
jgi:LuxR family transcriptional regulator, maltose regulon positive regulatory protein